MMAEYLPAHEKQWMNALFCFAQMHNFYLIYKTVFISNHKFYHFYSSESLPPSHHDWEAVWGLVVSSA